ncbi:MAG: pitrilysin family protein [Candidatus Zixiibacteriota bacterium]
MVRKKKARRDQSVFRKTTLKDGLRVLTEQLPGVRSVSLGAWVDVGSRCEQQDEHGLCHFLEHLVFKGTRQRNARQIAESLESLGGSLNAFTTREHTCYTARILDEYLPQAVEILADLTCNPTLTRTNMDRERQVICEEIKESLDDPSDHIHDLFAETHWSGHPLGRPVLGSMKIIRSVPRAHLTRFHANNYRSGSVVVAASGAISHDRLVKLVRAKFHLEEGGSKRPDPAGRKSGVHLRFESDDSAQTHFCIGFPGLPYGHRDRMAVVLLSTYLGGGMSSVLFQKIREERGLVYVVHSYHDSFVDTGVFSVYLGTAQKHLKQAFDLILAECRKTVSRRLNSAVLASVKAQMKGHLMLAMESTSTRMNRIGRQELLLERYQPLSGTIREIDKITSADIQRVAETIFDESQMTVAALGPSDPKQFAGLG